MTISISIDGQQVKDLAVGQEIYVKWHEWYRMNTVTMAYSSVERLEDGEIPGKKGLGKRYKAFKTNDSLSGTGYCDYFRSLGQALVAVGIDSSTQFKSHLRDLVIPEGQEMGC